MVTSRDVAREAGVSQSSVSRVISGDPRVDAAIRTRVESAMKALGYSPNAAARTMRTSRSGNIGVVTAKLHNPIYPAMLHELGQTLRAHGLQMVVWNSDETDQQIALLAARQRSVDGVIFTSATRDGLLLYNEISSCVPVVLINRTVDGWSGDQVSSDNGGGARQMASYFIEAGKKRCALITGPLIANTIRDRELGFRNEIAALSASLPASRVVRTSEFTYQAGYDAMVKLLEARVRPDAVFCINDVLAMGAVDAARKANIGFPQDIWVSGFDGVEMAGWYAFDLTTVRQPLTDMVSVAVRLLTERLQQRDKPATNLCLPIELIVRRSTANWRARAQAARTHDSAAAAAD